MNFARPWSLFTAAIRRCPQDAAPSSAFSTGASTLLPELASQRNEEGLAEMASKAIVVRT